MTAAQIIVAARLSRALGVPATDDAAIVRALLALFEHDPILIAHVELAALRRAGKRKARVSR